MTKKATAWCLGVLSLGAFLTPLIAAPSPAQPRSFVKGNLAEEFSMVSTPIETGFWFLDDDSSITGGPWSSSPTQVQLWNHGDDYVLRVEIYHPSNGATSVQAYSGAGLHTFGLPANGTITILDPNDENDEGAEGQYRVF